MKNYNSKKEDLEEEDQRQDETEDVQTILCQLLSFSWSLGLRTYITKMMERELDKEPKVKEKWILVTVWPQESIRQTPLSLP